LVCAALANGRAVLTGALDSEDTQVMIRALRQLGIVVDHDPVERTLQVTGCGGELPVRGAELYVANSGTTMRFLTALVALGHGRFRLHGVARMHERPIRDLIAGLRQLGVDARSEADNGCPPVIVDAAGMGGGRVEIAGDVSSQFLSGLMMAAPCARSPVDIHVVGGLVSKPYVRMTNAVMTAFGSPLDVDDLVHFHIDAPRRYDAPTDPYAIEPDASAATYFMGAAAIAGGRVTVLGLSPDSLQGDTEFWRCLEAMGCAVEWGPDGVTLFGRRPLRGIEVDMNAISDTVQTLGAVALFAEGPTTITGVGHIRHKETDRLHALATELRKCGAGVDEYPDGLRIWPQTLHGATIDTYDDHRMAMSMALVGLAIPGIVIRDPGCTRKTYPGFFQDLERLTRG
jgi:3-phosphoshikimate 1-carboxyvinyltransferase